MKKAMIWFLLFTMFLFSSQAIAAPPCTVEMLLDNWCDHMIDQSTPWAATAAFPKGYISPDECISQRDALFAAAQSMVQLGLETPESLSKQYSAKCAFTFAELYNLYVWRIDLCVWQNGRRLNLYSIQVDAVSGQLFSIRSLGSFYAYDPNYDYDVPKLPKQYWEQAPSMDALLDYWDTLYSESPMYSPEIQHREAQGYPLPGPDDMTQRTALRIAAQMAIALSKRDIDTFYGYIPRVEFDVSPAASTWFITLLNGAGDVAPCESFSFTLNAKTQTLESLIWHNEKSVCNPS